MSEIPEQLRRHRQLYDNSCAASAFESIVKLEGLIKPDDFPLQSDPSNRGMGFGDKSFLESFGFKVSEPQLSVTDAIARLKDEINDGRFPLAVMVVKERMVGNTLIYDTHVYVGAKQGGTLQLIDPAVPKIQAEGVVGIEKELQGSIDRFPYRKLIHVLMYSKPK